MNPSDALKAIRAKYKESQGKFFTFQLKNMQDIKGQLVLQLENDKTVYTLTGPLTEHVFQGTLDEIIPTLMEKAKLSKIPAVLANNNFTRFTLIKYFDKICPSGEGYLKIQTGLEKDKNNEYIAKKSSICIK